jgi:hypothetical protein
MPNPPEYRITRADADFPLPGNPAFWENLPALTIDHYLWLDNGYAPRVEVKLCWSALNLYVFFKVFESEITVRFAEFQDPVYKDSCVELFVDPFPEKNVGYVNIETNAIGAVLIAVGPGRTGRTPIPRDDLKGFEIVSALKKPMQGPHGAEFWTLTYRLPLALFEKYYNGKIRPGRRARANFYKCGDDAAPAHYGAWSPVLCAEPDFHRPEFFGSLRFL